jgi:hypothetical protein
MPWEQQGYGENMLQPGTGGSIPGMGWGANFTPSPSPVGQSLGSGSFFIPKQQGYGQAGQPAVMGGYSPTGMGIQNYLQGGQMPTQIPQGQMPQGLPNMPTGTYDPMMAQYFMQGGLQQQRFGQGQSGIAQGIQNYANQLSTLGIPTGMEGARQVADIAAGGQATEQKQQTQDMLSALQGQRGTGAGLGSNVDQLMATALGTQSANLRSVYANALVNYLQNQAQMAASGPRTLAPNA